MERLTPSNALNRLFEALGGEEALSEVDLPGPKGSNDRKVLVRVMGVWPGFGETFGE